MASLKATFIRQAIQRAINKSRQHANEPKVEVPQLIVYNFPTIGRLTIWMQTVLSCGQPTTNSTSSLESHIAAIRALADKYRLQALPHQSSATTCISNDIPDVSRPRVILITGTTGGLGCHMLHQLAQDTTIHRIYAMGRASDDDQLRARQRAVLEDRGLPTNILDDSRIILLAAEVMGEIAEERSAEVTLATLILVCCPLIYSIPCR